MSQRNELLGALIDLRDRQVQKARIQFGNRLDALERGADDTAGTAQRSVVEYYHERFQELEDRLNEDIVEMVNDLAEGEPIFEHLQALKGIGPMLAAKLIVPIDIERAKTVSALWRYAGFAVIDGARERPKKGEKLHYNKRLKTTLWLIGTSFLRSGSPYRRVYDAAKEQYELKRPEWTKGHRHNAAMGKMIKVFLSHVWERWRVLSGLPTREIYVVEQLRHTMKYKIGEFGWPSL